MPSSAGQLLEAGRIPGERIATTTEDTDSANFTTTEVELMSVTAPVVTGRTYAVVFFGRIASSVTDDNVIVRLREDNSAGTQIGDAAVDLTFTAQNTHGVPAYIYTEYTADATENKVFLVYGIRTGGTGNCRLDANSPNRIAYLFVDYVSG